MHLDNVENESAPRVEEYLSKIKVIRQIAHKIIYFLARIEYFLKNCGSRRSSWRKPITASPWIGSPRNYILRLLPTMPNEKNGCPICGSHPEITELEDYTEFCGVPFPGDHGMEENSADLTANELQDRLTQGEIFGLVDVHQLEETKISRISGVEFIPYDILAGELDRFTPDEKIVLICRTGNRSRSVQRLFQNAGYKNDWNLRGGINAWSREVDPSI